MLSVQVHVSESSGPDMPPNSTTVLPSVAAQFKFPKPNKLFTIDSLGGWTKVNTVFFTPTTGVVAKIEQGLGVSTSSG